MPDVVDADLVVFERMLGWRVGRMPATRPGQFSIISGFGALGCAGVGCAWSAAGRASAAATATKAANVVRPWTIPPSIEPEPARGI